MPMGDVLLQTRQAVQRLPVRALRRVLLAGVDSRAGSPADQLQVLHANATALLTIGLMLLFNGLFLATGCWGLILAGALQIPAAVALPLVFRLNAQARYRLASVFGFVVTLFALSVSIFLAQGTSINGHYFILLMGLIGLPIFRQDWRVSGPLVVLCVALFLFLEAQGWPAYPGEACVSPAWSQALSVLSVGISLTVAWGALIATEVSAETHARSLAAFASEDMLTGLPNRRAAMDRLRREIRHGHRQGVPLAVALVDIDFFKAINDQEGHETGDLALKHTASVMRRALRESDFIGRIGGEEFLVILPQTTLSQAQAVLDGMRAALARTPLRWTPANQPARERPVTVSVGVTGSLQAASEQALLHEADLALYRSKRDGRNRVSVFTLSID